MNGKDGSRRLEKTLCPRVWQRLGKDVMSSGVATSGKRRYVLGCGDVWEKTLCPRGVATSGKGITADGWSGRWGWEMVVCKG